MDASDRRPAREGTRAPIDCVVYAWLRVEDDGGSARLALAPSIEKWLASGLYAQAYRLAGVESPLEPAFAAGELAETLAVSGDPPACAAAIGEFAEVGARSVVLVPVGPDIERQVARLAEGVLPALEGSFQT